jgi:hypothetical protein
LLGNLIYYLAREEKAKVSIAKLKQALEQREFDKPLTQECIEEEKKVLQRANTDLLEGTIPAPVRHLIYWLD